MGWVGLGAQLRQWMVGGGGSQTLRARQNPGFVLCVRRDFQARNPKSSCSIGKKRGTLNKDRPVDFPWGCSGELIQGNMRGNTKKSQRCQVAEVCRTQNPRTFAEPPWVSSRNVRLLGHSCLPLGGFAAVCGSFRHPATFGKRAARYSVRYLATFFTSLDVPSSTSNGRD